MARERGHSELRTAHLRGGGQVRNLGMIGRIKGEGLGYTRPIGYHGPVGYRSPVPGSESGKVADPARKEGIDAPGQLASRENDGRVRQWIPGPDVERGSQKDQGRSPHREYLGWRGDDGGGRSRELSSRDARSSRIERNPESI